jgi:hypothetical protein
MLRIPRAHIADMSGQDGTQKGETHGRTSSRET